MFFKGDYFYNRTTCLYLTRINLSQNKKIKKKSISKSNGNTPFIGVSENHLKSFSAESCKNLVISTKLLPEF